MLPAHVSRDVATFRLAQVRRVHSPKASPLVSDDTGFLFSSRTLHNADERGAWLAVR